MKGRVLLIAAAVTFLVLSQQGSWSQNKLAVAADDMFYGTWINENMTYQKSFVFPGGWKNFSDASDAQALEEGTQEIVAKWTDSDGNTWYKTNDTVTFGIYPKGRLKGQSTAGQAFHSLFKFDKSGDTREKVGLWVFSSASLAYPTKIDPGDISYSIHYRAKE